MAGELGGPGWQVNGVDDSKKGDVKGCEGVEVDE